MYSISQVLKNSETFVFNKLNNYSRNILDFIRSVFLNKGSGVHLLGVCLPKGEILPENIDLERTLLRKNDPCVILPDTPITTATRRFFIKLQEPNSYKEVLKNVSRHVSCCYDCSQEEDFFCKLVDLYSDFLMTNINAAAFDRWLEELLTLTRRQNYCHTLFIIVPFPYDWYRTIFTVDGNFFPSFFEYIVLGESFGTQYATDMLSKLQENEVFSSTEFLSDEAKIIVIDTNLEKKRQIFKRFKEKIKLFHIKMTLSKDIPQNDDDEEMLDHRSNVKRIH